MMSDNPKKFDSFYAWLNQGHLSQYLKELRVPSKGLTLMTSNPDAGDLSDPPLSEFILTRVDHVYSRTELKADYGAGSFSSRLEPLDFTLSLSGHDSKILTDAPLSIRGISFSPELFKSFFDLARPNENFIDFGALHARSFKSSRLNSLVEMFFDNIVHGESGRLFTESASVLVASELSRLEGLKPLPDQGGLSPRKKRLAIEILNDLYKQDLGLKEIAKQVGLSPFHFSRMFKQSLGQSPIQYQKMVRVRVAKELLSNTNLKIIDIALEVGYESAQAFARMFRAETGFSPSDWRRLSSK